ncbi:Alpha/beta hydrolase family-domain-containing protein, partial [Xylariales sp. PMI_506]
MSNFCVESDRNMHFTCKTHIVPCCHIRHYSKSTSRSQNDELYLQVKQYVPLNYNPKDGDVTILAAHANGYPKELYEPLWDELYEHVEKYEDFRIRGIWIADMFNQGASGEMNASKLGNEPSWFDAARDYLNLVNHFRREMPSPIFGVGHSVGGTIMLNLALLHPRLLTGVFAVEPMTTRSPREFSLQGAYRLSQQPTRWPSWEHAIAYVRRSAFFKHWDPRVVDVYIANALRPVDGAAGAEYRRGDVGAVGGGEITTVTSRHQDILTFARAAYPT